jgi:hypothetical protein
MAKPGSKGTTSPKKVIKLISYMLGKGTDGTQAAEIIAKPAQEQQSGP